MTQPLPWRAESLRHAAEHAASKLIEARLDPNARDTMRAMLGDIVRFLAPLAPDALTALWRLLTLLRDDPAGFTGAANREGEALAAKAAIRAPR